MIAFVLCMGLSAAEPPFPVQVMLEAAENQLRQQRPDRARAMLVQAKTDYPKDGRVDFLYGVSYAQEDKNELGIASFKAAIEKTPKLRIAHLQLGILYDVLEKYDEAVKVYQKALEIFPNDVEFMAEWGQTLLLNKRFKEAEDVLKRALAVAPKNAEVMADLAHAEARLGRPNDAVRRFEKSITLGNTDPDMKRQYGDALSASGELAKAEAIYTELLAKLPHNAELYFRRYKVREAKGDKNGAALDKIEWEKRKNKGANK
jgi:Flp pilus assembly protein TadD